jgi:hypothetical protein
MFASNGLSQQTVSADSRCSRSVALTTCGGITVFKKRKKKKSNFTQKKIHFVFSAAKIKSRQHPRQGCSFTYQLKYWWGAYHFKNIYSPITLANISSINLVSIFRCSSSPSNPVCPSRVDSSTLVFSLSSHRHSYIGLVFSSRFID